jgi:hypothetical protein
MPATPATQPTQLGSLHHAATTLSLAAVHEACPHQRMGRSGNRAGPPPDDSRADVRHAGHARPKGFQRHCGVDCPGSWLSTQRPRPRGRAERLSASWLPGVSGGRVRDRRTRGTLHRPPGGSISGNAFGCADRPDRPAVVGQARRDAGSRDRRRSSTAGHLEHRSGVRGAHKGDTDGHS